MPQLLLTATSLSATASASAELTKALLLLEERLAAWSRDAIAVDALLQEVFGVETNTNSQRAALLTSISGSGLEINLQIVDATSIDGLIAAYTSAAPDGGERIYLNASWLSWAHRSRSRPCCSRNSAMPSTRLNGGRDAPVMKGRSFRLF